MAGIEEHTDGEDSVTDNGINCLAFMQNDAPRSSGEELICDLSILYWKLVTRSQNHALRRLLQF